MKHLRWLALLLVAGCATTTPQSVDAIIQQQRGKTIAVAVYDVRDGRMLLRDEHESFHAASTMKVPVMMAVYDAAARGELRLDQPVQVHNEFTSIYDGSKFSCDPHEDSDKEVYTWIGRAMPLDTLVRHMIDRSSNLATDDVIELVGAANVMSIMTRIGADEVHVLRGVEDQKAFDHAMNNTTSAYGLMMVYRAIVASPDAKPMLDVLSAQEFNSGIPAGVPPGTRVAHKTGNITNFAHDSGVGSRPDGSAYILVVLTRGYPKTKDANKVIAEISRAVWQEFGPRTPSDAVQ
ncbi:MAG TPA: serine hydrolase [Thermoanaerobaculia bacterium]|nr:serine hydrolase [Thermoanaerobaculia bacterium]